MVSALFITYWMFSELQFNMIYYYYFRVYFQYKMSQLNNTSAETTKQRQLAIRRAEYLKKVRIRVKSAQKVLDDDHLIIIQTFNTQKHKVIEIVMRKISELDNLINHIKIQYGGHIIPLFNHNLYFQSSLPMQKIIPEIQEYLNDLKYNKYCRQDVKFYCFMIQQNSSFPKELGFQRMISNATDRSRKYLNQLFTRKQNHSLKDTGILLSSKQQLDSSIQNYTQLKQLTLAKIKQILVFEQISQIFVQMCVCPTIAIQPQDFDIEFIYNIVNKCEKLITQAIEAFTRWQLLVDSVRQLQNNVYKGLHEFENQFNQKNNQLKQWSQSLSVEFNELSEYLNQKTQALSCSLYKLNKKFIDATVFAGQTMKEQDDSQVQKVENKKDFFTVNRQNSQILQGISQMSNQVKKEEVNTYKFSVEGSKNNTNDDRQYIDCSDD